MRGVFEHFRPVWDRLLMDEILRSLAITVAQTTYLFKELYIEKMESEKGSRFLRPQVNFKA